MRKISRATSGVVILLLSGCSYLEDYFPDKEKDYQYTTEIPMLNWPSELRGNKAGAGAGPGQSTDSGNPAGATDTNNPADANNPTGNSTTAAGGESAAESTAAANVSSTEVKNTDDDQNIISSVEVVKYDDGESRLRLGTTFSKAWRAVSKALSHKSIEVTGRNHDQGLITAQYDPNEKQAKDDSFLDEIKFFFQGIDTNEQEYQLKLEEHAENTDVLVLNKEHLPMLNNEAALHLLKVIADSIKTDQVGKKAE